MKRLLAIAVLLAVRSGFAGLTYDFRSQTTGMQNTTLDGAVAAEGASVRIAVDHGDGMVFRSGSTVLSTDGGNSFKVFDPATRTYYVVSLDQIAGSAAAMLNGGTFKISFQKPVAVVRDAGDGGRVQGYPTRKSHLDASIDVVIDAVGQTMKSRLSMQGDSWTTDQLSGSDTNIFQQQGLRTGIEALDKLIDVQASALKGRFPLKQVTTVRLSQSGRDITSTTTVTVSKIRRITLNAATFKEPDGYERTDSPIEAMKKRLK